MSWEDRSSRIDPFGEPTWVQVTNDLRKDIESGALPPGTKLPSQPALAEIYGVARGTVDKAIRKLRDEGLLGVSIGRGTFVRERR
jgi:DNA-binding GntR family transcriptional regulator